MASGVATTRLKECGAVNFELPARKNKLVCASSVSEPSCYIIVQRGHCIFSFSSLDLVSLSSTTSTPATKTTNISLKKMVTAMIIDDADRNEPRLLVNSKISFGQFYQQRHVALVPQGRRRRQSQRPSKRGPH